MRIFQPGAGLRLELAQSGLCRWEIVFARRNQRGRGVDECGSDAEVKLILLVFALNVSPRDDRLASRCERESGFDGTGGRVQRPTFAPNPPLALTSDNPIVTGRDRTCGSCLWRRGRFLLRGPSGSFSSRPKSPITGGLDHVGPRADGQEIDLKRAVGLRLAADGIRHGQEKVTQDQLRDLSSARRAHHA